MSESFIQLPPDSTGKRARSILRTINANAVYEEVMLIAEPTQGSLISIATEPTLGSINAGVQFFRATIGAAPPSGGIVFAGYDSANTILTRISTDQYGRVIASGRSYLSPLWLGEKFTTYGYRHFTTLRPSNDIYDVVATPDYYIANDRNMFTNVYELCVYSRETGSRISSMTINAHLNFDITDDGTKVLYYNGITQRLETRDLPLLNNPSTIATLSWGAGVYGCVKYDAHNQSTIMVAKGGDSIAVLYNSSGTPISTIQANGSITTVNLEPETYNIAVSNTYSRASLYYILRSSGATIGMIPNLFEGVMTIHTKLPFTTFCNDKGLGFMTEFGGCPYGVYHIQTNCLYPILSENVLVGTYYFSIFEIPMSRIFSDKLKQPCTIVRNCTINPNGTIDFSFLHGMDVIIRTSQPSLFNIRKPVLSGYVGYARVYANSSVDYIETDSTTGTICRLNFSDVFMWGNVEIVNMTSNTCSVTILGGIFT